MYTRNTSKGQSENKRVGTYASFDDDQEHRLHTRIHKLRCAFENRKSTQRITGQDFINKYTETRIIYRINKKCIIIIVCIFKYKLNKF